MNLVCPFILAPTGTATPNRPWQPAVSALSPAGRYHAATLAASADAYHCCVCVVWRAYVCTGLASNASLDGGLAIAVPLEVKGLWLAWQRHGRLPWARLVRPSAAIARHGFALHPYMYRVVTGNFTLGRLMVSRLPGLLLVPQSCLVCAWSQ